MAALSGWLHLKGETRPVQWSRRWVEVTVSGPNVHLRYQKGKGSPYLGFIDLTDARQVRKLGEDRPGQYGFSIQVNFQHLCQCKAESAVERARWVRYFTALVDSIEIHPSLEETLLSSDDGTTRPPRCLARPTARPLPSSPSPDAKNQGPAKLVTLSSKSKPSSCPRTQDDRGSTNAWAGIVDALRDADAQEGLESKLQGEPRRAERTVLSTLVNLTKRRKSREARARKAKTQTDGGTSVVERWLQRLPQHPRRRAFKRTSDPRLKADEDAKLALESVRSLQFRDDVPARIRNLAEVLAENTNELRHVPRLTGRRWHPPCVPGVEIVAWIASTDEEVQRTSCCAPPGGKGEEEVDAAPTWEPLEPEEIQEVGVALLLAGVFHHVDRCEEFDLAAFSRGTLFRCDVLPADSEWSTRYLLGEPARQFLAYLETALRSNSHFLGRKLALFASEFSASYWPKRGWFDTEAVLLKGSEDEPVFPWVEPAQSFYPFIVFDDEDAREEEEGEGGETPHLVERHIPACAPSPQNACTPPDTEAQVPSAHQVADGEWEMMWRDAVLRVETEAVVETVVDFAEALQENILSYMQDEDSEITWEHVSFLVEDVLFGSVYDTLFPIYQAKLFARDMALRSKLQKLSMAGPWACHVERDLWLINGVDDTEVNIKEWSLRAVHQEIVAAYGPAIDELRKVPHVTSPFAKLARIVDALQLAAACVTRWWGLRDPEKAAKLAIGADQFVPLLTFLVVKAFTDDGEVDSYGRGLHCLLAEMTFLADYTNSLLCSGEEGYALATLQICVAFLEREPLDGHTPD